MGTAVEAPKTFLRACANGAPLPLQYKGRMDQCCCSQPWRGGGEGHLALRYAAPWLQNAQPPMVRPRR